MRRWPTAAATAALVAGTAVVWIVGSGVCARFCPSAVAGGGCTAFSCYRMRPLLFAALHAGVAAGGAGLGVACRLCRNRIEETIGTVLTG